MGLHGVRLAVYMVFTGGVKMKLSEIELNSIDCNMATCRIIYLYGMAIVQDFIASSLVCKFDRLQICLDKTSQIDGRLVLSRTGTVIRTECSPIIRTFFTGIAPVRAVTGINRRGCQQYAGYVHFSFHGDYPLFPVQ